MCSVLPFLGCWIVLDCNPFANVTPFGLDVAQIFFDLHRTLPQCSWVFGYPYPLWNLIGNSEPNREGKNETNRHGYYGDAVRKWADFGAPVPPAHVIPCYFNIEKPPRTEWRTVQGGEVKEDDKRLSSWCWSRSRVASLHCPLSSPTVLFQRVTNCNLHPCHVGRCCVEFVCLLHQLEILLIGELDWNRFHAFNLLLRCSEIESPFRPASALSFWAVSLSVFNVSFVVLGCSFFLLSIMVFSVLRFCCALKSNVAKMETIPLHQE